jgi:hypothetical protein
MNNRTRTFGKAMMMCRKIPWYVMDVSTKYFKMIDENNARIEETQKRIPKKFGIQNMYNKHKDYWKRKSMKGAHCRFAKVSIAMRGTTGYLD